jgi:hypothetical protein
MRSLYALRSGAVGRGTALHAARSRIGVIGIFHYLNPSGRTTALGTTESLTEITTRGIFRGLKAAVA